MKTMMKEVRFFFRMLKEALAIPYKNPNFIIFSSLTSLPLFIFMLINDFIIQQTLIQTAKMVTTPLQHVEFYDFHQTSMGLADRLIGKVSHKLLLLGFMYLGVLHFLDFLNTVAIVDSASVIYKGETPMSLMDMLSRPIKETRFRGPLITSIYTLILASLAFCGLISLAAHMFFILKTLFALILFGMPFIALLVKSVEWTAIWNMSIVISILEEKHGDIALVMSSYFSRESRKFGPLFMVIFFVWRLALRIACLYMGWRKGQNGIGITSLHIGLLCLGNTMKWLVFVVYLHYCKKCRLERADVEVGRADETVKEGYDRGSSSSSRSTTAI